MSRLGSNPDGEPALPMFPTPRHATGPGGADPQIDDRNRQLIELRAAAPMRGSGFRQDDIDGLALFDQHRSPGLL